MITVMGANGNTGRVVVDTLRARGLPVRALGRSKNKLEPLAKLGAEVRTGDAEDARFLMESFRGSSAVYTLIPADPAAADFRKYQDEIGEATIRAIRDAGVKRIVFLSSVGGEQPSGSGPIAGLHAQEERLRGLSGVSVLALRPGYFFENFFHNLGMIRHQGINGGAMRGDLPVPMIATRDIGAFAANALAGMGHPGFGTRDLYGPRDYTHTEATTILGERIGKPGLAYVQFPYDAFQQALAATGLSADVARLYTDMAKGFNDGLIRHTEPRTPENTGPTRFEEFADVLAAAYRSG